MASFLLVYLGCPLLTHADHCEGGEGSEGGEGFGGGDRPMVLSAVGSKPPALNLHNPLPKQKREER